MDEEEVASWLKGFALNDLLYEQERERRDVLLRFLDVLASFDRCFAAIAMQEEIPPTMHSWLRSIDMVRTQLIRALEQTGVTFMSCVGQLFDPRKHEAIEIQMDGESEENTILEEIVRGCEWRGEILCYAKVVVACSSAHVSRHEQKESE